MSDEETPKPLPDEPLTREQIERLRERPKDQALSPREHVLLQGSIRPRFPETLT